MINIIHVALFWGVLFVVIPLVYLFSKSTLNSLFGSLAKPQNLYFSGVLSIVLALITLSVSWGVPDLLAYILNVIAVISLAKGISRLFFPKISQRSISYFRTRPKLVKLMLILAIIVGLFLVLFATS